MVQRYNRSQKSERRAYAAIERYHVRSLPEFPLCTCRSTVQSRGKLSNRCTIRGFDTYLLVEHAIPLVDICDIALLLVVPLPREFLLLVDTLECVNIKTRCNEWAGTHSLLSLLTTRSIASSLGLLSA